MSLIKNLSIFFLMLLFVSGLSVNMVAQTPIFQEDFEGDLSDWTFENPAANFWHKLTNPHLINVYNVGGALQNNPPNDICPDLVLLPDMDINGNAFLGAAQSGSSVLWYGVDNHGTFLDNTGVAPYYDMTLQALDGGGTSLAPNSGGVISPEIDLAGITDAYLKFKAWWEIEGVASASFDVMKIEVTTDNGVTYTELGRLNPLADLAMLPHEGYSSGGAKNTPKWVTPSYDLSAYAGQKIKVRFSFASNDQLYNAYRGWMIDDVECVDSSLPAPVIYSISPCIIQLNTITTTNIIITGCGFNMTGTVTCGGVIATECYVFGLTKCIFKIPATLGIGTYSITFTNPDGQLFTYSNCITIVETISNDPPIAFDDTATLPSTGGLIYPLGNDTDTDGDPLSIIHVSDGANGTTTISADFQSIVYTPNPGFTGIDTISYKITDPKGGQDTGLITVDVSGSTQPSIVVTCPNGGEIWYLNSSVNITWNAIGVSGPVTISIWQNGIKIGVIAQNITATLGTYSWLVGQYIGGNVQAGTGYTIKIKAENQKIWGFSISSFTISQSSITITSANGGEDWCIGSSKNITWTAVGLTQNIRISLWQNGVELDIIAMSVDPSLGSYNWTVGNGIGGTALAGSGFKIKVKQINTKIMDFSNADFSLSPATSLKVSTPNGGGILQSGAPQNITWNSCGLSGVLTISLWKDGVKVGIIAKSVDISTGSYAWTVGQYIGGTVPPGTDYKIKLKEENLKVLDYSDLNFTIN